MGMDATIVAIGRLDHLRAAGALDHHRSFYNETKPGEHILSTIWGANTSEASRDMAILCCVDLTRPQTFRITNLKTVADWPPDQQEFRTQLCKLIFDGVQVWFMPND